MLSIIIEVDTDQYGSLTLRIFTTTQMVSRDKISTSGRDPLVACGLAELVLSPVVRLRNRAANKLCVSLACPACIGFITRWTCSLIRCGKVDLRPSVPANIDT